MDYKNVIVTDFDGTMTEQDFYLLAIEKLLPQDQHDHWADYRAGRITHFEGLRRYFADIRAPLERVLGILNEMRLSPSLRSDVDRLRKGGWQVIVASAGCGWYIQRLLAEAGVELEVHANPGEYSSERGLLMREPLDSPYYSPELGVDKALIVRTMIAQGKKVAYAGDGLPDILPSKIVSDDLRFARSSLAKALDEESISYRPYSDWSDIADELLTR